MTDHHCGRARDQHLPKVKEEEERGAVAPVALTLSVAHMLTITAAHATSDSRNKRREGEFNKCVVRRCLDRQF